MPFLSTSRLPRPAPPLLAGLLLSGFLPAAAAPAQDRGAEDVLAADRYDYRGERGEADAVDARFPQDPERVRDLKKIRRAVVAGDWDGAADGLLDILERGRGKVVRLADGSAATVVDEANRLLDAFPAAERRALSRRLGGAARVAFERAAAGGGPAGLRDVAVRFPATDAARDATDRLAALHLDRGEAGAAARLFGAILEDPFTPPAYVERPRWRARAAAAFARAGDPARARELWAGVPAADRAALGLGDEDPAAGLPPALAAGASLTPPAPTAAVREPLLVPRWTVPIVAEPEERAEFREVVDRLGRAGVPLLPVWEPLTVATAAGDLVLTRTAAGVVAVDAATGDRKWRSRDMTDAAGGSVGPSTYYYRPDYGSEAEQNDAVAAVYRNAAFGVLTADGERVFLLEVDDPQAGVPAASSAGLRYGRPAPPAEPVRLAAYRLDTGRLDWEVGGAQRDEPFDLPLAGWRVLAAPTVSGGDLFAVAERVAPDGQRRIALFCLDPASGLPRWERTVAFSEVAVDLDPTRAEWGAFCAVAGGVVVVPTTVGWVAGVDRLTREILWVRRVFEPELGGGRGFGRGFGGSRQANLADRKELADYWRPGPPRVAGGRVVVAPPGEDRYYGLDLLTGEELWRPRRRRTWKALAGLLPAGLFVGNADRGLPPADAGALVLVGPRSVAAVSLDDGSNRVWTYTVPEGLGRPSGLPLIAGDRLLVPLTGGTLVTLDAATGKPLDTARRADVDRAAGERVGGLGALAVAGGRLVSVGPGGLVGFEDRAGLAADLLAADRAGGPPDPRLALREAELLRTAGRTDEALAKLTGAAGASGGDGGGPGAAGLSGADAARFRALLRATLRDAALAEAGGVGPPPGRQDELLGRLGALADTDARRIAAARLRADRLLARGEPAAAVGALRDLIADRLGDDAAADRNPLVPAADGDAPPPPAADPDAPPPDAEVRLSRAVSGQLRAVWEAGGDGRDAVDRLAVELLAESAATFSPTAPAAELLAFHPAVAAALLEWAAARLPADEAAAGGPASGAAELTLFRLAETRSDALADRADELLGRLREAGGEAGGDGGGPAAFGVVAEALPSGAQIEPPTALPSPAAVRPFFRSHALVAAAGGGRLDVLGPLPALEDAAPGDAAPGGGKPGPRARVIARFPLRGGGGEEDSSPTRRTLVVRGDVVRFGFDPGGSAAGPAVGFVGGVVFAVTDGAVAAVHPRTGATLWDRAVPDARPVALGEAALGVPTAAAEEPRVMNRAARQARTGGRRPRGGVVAANAEVVVTLDDRTLTVLDALTGDTIWVRRRLEAEAPAAVATSTAVIVTPTGRGGGPGLALAARDGRPLAAREQALGVSMKALAVAGPALVHVVPNTLVPAGGGANGQGYFVRAWDPASDRPLWLRPVGSESKIAVLPGAGAPVAAVVHPDGPDDDAEDEGFLLDLRTGGWVTLGGVNAGGASLTALADADRVLLAARPQRGPVRRFDADDLPTETLGGTLDLFARAGGRLWRADAAGAELLHGGFDRLPFVLLLTPDPEARRGRIDELELVALDKRTGRELLRTVIPTLGSLDEVAAAPDGSELRLWNDEAEYWRLRVVPEGPR